MIKVTRYIDKENRIIGFKSSGHAEFAEHGQDIVCSAVSALVINSVNSINEFTEDVIDYQVDEVAGIIDFIIQSDLSDKSELLLKSLFLGLKSIQDSYGSEYINFYIKKNL